MGKSKGIEFKIVTGVEILIGVAVVAFISSAMGSDNLDQMYELVIRELHKIIAIS